MDSLRELYQQVILDHGRNPRNFEENKEAQITQSCHNPLCGDQIHVYCDLDAAGKRFEQLTFTGQGCTISVASASLLLMALQKKETAYFERLYQYLKGLLTGKECQEVLEELELSEEDQLNIQRIRMLAGVREYPSRVKCATCAWHTVQAILRGGETVIKTE
jgi:nitrogen fixation NifU-like protein